jgi:KRAB domain-containing zinc finger protein
VPPLKNGIITTTCKIEVYIENFRTRHSSVGNCFAISSSAALEKRGNLEKDSNTVHLGKKDFKCDQCDKAYSQKGDLNTHINATHKKIKGVWCDLCDYSSYTRADLEKHSNNVHLEKKNFKCGHCNIPDFKIIFLYHHTRILEPFHWTHIVSQAAVYGLVKVLV